MLEKCGVEEGEALEGERVCGVEWGGNKRGKDFVIDREEWEGDAKRE